MTKNSWHLENPLTCPLVHAVSIIGGKWKPIIIHMLSTGIHRFGEIKKNIPPISQKVLTQQLRELESDGLVIRNILPKIPPHVEYSLTQQGHELKPIIHALYKWGERLNAMK